MKKKIVILETLRKYPPLPATNRYAKNDYKVPGTDHIIEKGTALVIPIFAIHNDPEYYPNPKKFDPNRFSSDELTKRHPMAWIPFSEGPR